jgi:hypothetical protein
MKGFIIGDSKEKKRKEILFEKTINWINQYRAIEEMKFSEEIKNFAELTSYEILREKWNNELFWKKVVLENTEWKNFLGDITNYFAEWQVLRSLAFYIREEVIKRYNVENKKDKLPCELYYYKVAKAIVDFTNQPAYEFLNKKAKEIFEKYQIEKKGLTEIRLETADKTLKELYEKFLNLLNGLNFDIDERHPPKMFIRLNGRYSVNTEIGKSKLLSFLNFYYKENEYSIKNGNYFVIYNNIEIDEYYLSSFIEFAENKTWEELENKLHLFSEKLDTYYWESLPHKKIDAYGRALNKLFRKHGTLKYISTLLYKLTTPYYWLPIQLYSQTRIEGEWLRKIKNITDEFLNKYIQLENDIYKDYIFYGYKFLEEQLPVVKLIDENEYLRLKLSVDYIKKRYNTYFGKDETDLPNVEEIVNKKYEELFSDKKVEKEKSSFSKFFRRIFKF